MPQIGEMDLRMVVQKIFGLIITLGVLALILFQHILYWYTRFLIRQSGIVATGTVVRKHQKRGGGKFILYQFEDVKGNKQSTLYQQDIQVWQNTYLKFNEGDEIRVRYLPQNPSKSTLIGDNFAAYGMIFVEFLILVLVVGCVVIIKTG